MTKHEFHMENIALMSAGYTHAKKLLNFNKR